MKYHLCKVTRSYCGLPYCGYYSDGMPMEFDSLYDAKAAAERLQAVNPVGWDIYNSETKELVIGHNFFDDLPII